MRKPLWILVCWLFGVSPLLGNDGGSPEAVQGYLDLSHWDFEQDGALTLRGDWSFHWQELFRPNTQQPNPPESKTFRKIPGFWNHPDAAGLSFPAHGYATYHLRIKSPGKWKQWALEVGPFYTAAEVHVNGEPLFTAGKVGPSAEQSEHSMRTGLITFHSEREYQDIVIVMSNFDHFKAGFGRMRFGPATVLIPERDNLRTLYYIALGAIAFMGLYHFGLFLLRRNEPSPLHLASYCLVNSAFTLISCGLVFDFFPNFNGEVWWKLFFATWYLGYTTFSKFAQSLFPKEFSPKFVTISNVLGIGGALFVIIFPFRIGGESAIVFQIFGLFHFAYMAYAVIKAHRRGRPHALVFISGSFIFFVMVTYDVLAAEGIIDSPPRSCFGLATFFLFQSYTLAARFSKAFTDLAVKEAEITELNSSLERKVEEKTRDIRSILVSIKQGIFMIKRTDDQRVAVHVDHSQFLESMFKTKRIADQDALELMFQNANITQEQKDITRSVIEASLGEAFFAFDVNSENLIKEYTVTSKNHELEIWEVDWTPVLHANQTIDKILVSLRDVTNLRQLQDEAVQRQKELEYISEIVNVSASNFDIFIRMCRGFLEENRRLISSNIKRNIEILKILFINMHTIKGNARGYQFRKMTGILHDAEQYYAELLNSEHVEWDQGKLLEDLQRVQDVIEKYAYINDVKLGRKIHENQVLIERQVVAERIDSLNLLDTSVLSIKDRGIIEETKSTFKNVFYSSALDVLEDILGESERLARDLKKDKPLVSIADPGISLTQEGQELFRLIFTHIVRNSLDHGIEVPDERIRKGKRPSGHIELKLDEKDGMLMVQYQDDGRGLNLAYLKELGFMRDLFGKALKPSREEIANLIFVAGLSTSASLSEISGRGVGMDAVKRYISQLGGSIRIILQPQVGDETSWSQFSLEIKLPQSLYSKAAAPLKAV
ncbi:MAG TPA: 7TM diverse intracellular signaling domain-containing protein [Oligoflexus sp.]|uniref:7TM diverse intracellular signaling domain-containing protein n=1 Tax=Oligoflexus sp. TaxID=1971216 RepID=UPI002D2E615A|nr:7TM diverse intracellular signaling domain-containing protein [Oligoflexus sp.]HYX37705.1 7TM diverse intracellular signaling domain-containing protein [Oligoflexus sp.]